MYSWIIAVCLSVGVIVAHFTGVSWTCMLIGLSVGAVFLVLQYKFKIHPLPIFVWNVILVGAMWYTIRSQIHEKFAEDDSPSFIENVSHRVSSATRGYMIRTGISEQDVNVLNAMLLGDRDSLHYEQKMRFRNAGVQHLLALSGLHLGIFIGILSFLFLRRARYSRWRWPVLLGTLTLLWGYCLVAGLPQSLLRAMLMTTLYYVCLYLRSYINSAVTLANTAWLMILIDPNAVFDLGTQLSFVAVAAILWIYPQLSNMLPLQYFPKTRWGRASRRLWSLFCVSLAAWFGTMPLCLYYFHQFQPWQPLTSVVLVPLTCLLLYFTVVLLTICLLHLWMLAGLVAKVVSAFMIVENTILEFAGSLPFSTLRCSNIHLGHVALLYLLMFIYVVGASSTRRVQRYAFLSLVATIAVLLLV